MKYYISDLHIGHANVICFDNRPFFTLDEMHETIIQNWNDTVNKNDDVYILGDFAWKNDIGFEVLKQLKGNKHLIKGNHDRINSGLEKQFVSVRYYDVVRDGKNQVVLCHYPIAHWINADYGYIHLYGHIHMGRDSRPFEEYAEYMRQRHLPYECYNVGCMLPYMNYTPRTLEEIIKGSR